MRKRGMPRDPPTWQGWPDVFFPKSPEVPNGWIRMWDETANWIVCFRVLDGSIHHGHDIPRDGLPPLDKETKAALMRQAQQQRQSQRLNLASPAHPSCGHSQSAWEVDTDQ